MRKNLINIHLYLAAFLAVPTLLIALSGGLYLLDIKGEVRETLVYTGSPKEIIFNAEDKTATVNRFLQSKGIDHIAEKALGNEKRYMTRPSSENHYEITVNKGELRVYQRQPSVIRRLIELHKGHGPEWFRSFQKLTAFGLLLVVISGFLLGLTSPKLRVTTLLITGSGLLLTLLLAL